MIPNPFTKYSRDVLDDLGMDIPKPRKPPKSPEVTSATTMSEPLDMDGAHRRWIKTGHPADMGKVLDQARPVIDSAITSFSAGQDGPAIRSEARLLAMEAAKTYKPDSGATLKNWMYNHLQGLRRYAAQSSPFQVPERVRLDGYRINQASSEFASDQGRDPDWTELADLTGLSVKRIKYVKKLDRQIINEGAITAGAEKAEGGDSDPMVAAIPDNNWVNIWAHYVYEDMSPADKKIYDMYTGRNGYQPTPVASIATALGMSSSAVSQRARRIGDQLAAGRDMKDKL